FFFFSSRRRHTRSKRDWSSDVCSSDLTVQHYKLGEPSADMTIQAFYSVKGDVTNAKMRTFVKQAVKKYGDELEEILPERFLIEYKIPTRKQAVKQLHLPTDNQQLK